MAVIRMIVQAMLAFRTWLGWKLELWFIISPIEGLQRLWCRLDPRLYSEQMRLRQVSEGQVGVHGARFCLLVVYASGSIPSFTQTIIDAIRRRGLNLAISTNARITNTVRETLLAKCSLLIERADLGRDFGGYKDGLSIIEQRFGTPERLILLNDSLFYLEPGLDGLVAALDGDDELIGMCEDLYLYYHIQSFALSFGPNVLRNPRIRRYWKAFKPISTRRWAIERGERRLTRELLRAGFRPRILYTAAQLVPHLKKRNFGELLEGVRLLPTMARYRLFQQLRELRIAKTVAPLPMLTTLSNSVRRLNKLNALDDRDLRDANLADILSISQRSLLIHEHHEEWAIETLGEQIASTVGDRNQMHFGGFLFRKYLGLPAIKRDLFYRELYPLEEIDEHLAALSAEVKEEVLADLRQRGTARLLSGLSRLLYQHGSI
jgi:hypothetical protein